VDGLRFIHGRDHLLEAQPGEGLAHVEAVHLVADLEDEVVPLRGFHFAGEFQHAASPQIGARGGGRVLHGVDDFGLADEPPHLARIFQREEEALVVLEQMIFEVEAL